MFRLFFTFLLLLASRGWSQINLSGCDGDIVHLHAEVAGGTYWWLLDGNYIGEGEQTIHADSVHVLELVASNGSCEQIQKFTLTLSPCDVFYIPNAFTPNDDGLNDEFKVHGNLAYEINIYDQWGTLIFSGSIPWPGNQVSDTYTYKAIIQTNPPTTVYGRVQLVK